MSSTVNSNRGRLRNSARAARSNRESKPTDRPTSRLPHRHPASRRRPAETGGQYLEGVRHVLSPASVSIGGPLRPRRRSGHGRPPGTGLESALQRGCPLRRRRPVAARRPDGLSAHRMRGHCVPAPTACRRLNTGRRRRDDCPAESRRTIRTSTSAVAAPYDSFFVGSCCRCRAPTK